MQKEQERQSLSDRLCAETISAMRSSIVASTIKIFAEIAQMCLAVSDFLSRWVLPSDLASEHETIEPNTTKVYPWNIEHPSRHSVCMFSNHTDLRTA